MEEEETSWLGVPGKLVGNPVGQRRVTMMMLMLLRGGWEEEGGGGEGKAAVGKLHSCSPQPLLVLVALTHDDLMMILMILMLMILMLMILILMILKLV